MSPHRLLLAIALMGVGWSQNAAAGAPHVNITSCPAYKTYLEVPRTPTALISFPGSGNTWVRHIIETVTGYHTTSWYCDKGLLRVFKAECDAANNYNQSIVVKTHRLRHCDMWQNAITIVRNPLHSIRAEYQRSSTKSHTEYMDPKDWDWNQWHHKSTQMCRKWKEMFEAVFGTADKPGCAQLPDYNMKVFFYEDLKTSTGSLNPYFLDELLSYFKIDRRDSFYECALQNHKGSYARQLPIDHPAARVLSDIQTLQNFESAGCMAAYRAYRREYSHLPQPVQST